MELNSITACFSERGRNELLFRNSRFYFAHTKKSGDYVWRCTVRKCTALLYTRTDQHLYHNHTSDHTHGIDIKKHNRQILSNAAKRKAIENDILEQPAKIINLVVKDNPQLYTTTTKNDVNLIRNNLYSQRRKEQPRLPDSIDETFDFISKCNYKTVFGENFISYYNLAFKMIIFSTISNYRLLCDSDNIFIDGTFTFCANFFYQFYTIHVEHSSTYR